MNVNTKNWRSDIYDVLREQNIEQVCYVPDAGHAALIRDCEADNKMTVIGLTTEEDGVGRVRRRRGLMIFLKQIIIESEFLVPVVRITHYW